ncbi:MAG: hypothetical protein K6F79_08000, partial [Saccharofermentans sp.]|nr:hypothetical protein [Saccharofermentans sp.]
QTAIAYDIAPLIETNTTEEGAKDLASSVFFENNTHFDMQDLYADVDAANINPSLHDYDTLSDAMREYFSDAFSTRVNNFMSSTFVLKTKLYTSSPRIWPLYYDDNDNYLLEGINNNQLRGIAESFGELVSQLACMENVQ